MTDRPDYKYSDAGRSQSKRSRQRNDCTVRAVTIAFGLEYDDVYDMLAALGRKCSRGFHLDRNCFRSGEFLGHRVVKLSFPAVRGQKRMRVARFIAEHPEGAFIVRTAGHVTAVVDGVAYDNHDTAEARDYFMEERCLYTAYQIHPNEEVAA